MINQKVFMVMPFSHLVANDNFEHNIKPICDERDLQIRRSDTIFTVNSFYDDIVSEIADANIVIVDITDNNPNVMYELGISHTLKRKRTILITGSEYNEIPSDFKHMRVIRYENNISGVTKFKKELSVTIDHLLEDSLEKYKKEFSFLYDVFSTTKQWHLMISIVGISKIKKILNINESLYFEGGYQKSQMTQSSIYLDKYFEFYDKNKFISLDNGLISLTNKGQLFAKFVEEKEIDCYFMNNEILKEGYELFHSRMYKEQESRKNKEES